MGTVARASCASCGYTKRFSDGVGMHPFTTTTALSPALCLGCRELVTVEASITREGEPSGRRPPPRCPACRRSVALYAPEDPLLARPGPYQNQGPEEQRQEWRGGISFLCPKCGEKKAGFVPTGLWD